MKISSLIIDEQNRRRIAINSAELREKASKEAISWKGGSSVDDKKVFPMYEYENFKIVLKKPISLSFAPEHRWAWFGTRKDISIMPRK